MTDHVGKSNPATSGNQDYPWAPENPDLEPIYWESMTGSVIGQEGRDSEEAQNEVFRHFFRKPLTIPGEKRKKVIRLCDGRIVYGPAKWIQNRASGGSTLVEVPFPTGMLAIVQMAYHDGQFDPMGQLGLGFHFERHDWSCPRCFDIRDEIRDYLVLGEDVRVKKNTFVPEPRPPFT